MKGRPSNTSSPFWKTTSQPQSHSTNQETTSSMWDLMGDLGPNSGVIKRYISGDQSLGQQRTLTNGKSLDEAEEKEVLMLQTNPQPHWYICKCKKKMFPEVVVCPLCTQGPNVWGGRGVSS